ncbi:putative permease [Thiomonas arsenitoxydans]|uniref:Permease n=1 Tax=Thiomonas arsenitoxydans (strain DSM 22701 / CIP 110005 / 3As) TaxID=426114 RepID=D6CKN0_THIA3|nr:DMT family transporter [Thiomonas arsenitoxydans]CAZ87498.1 putative permease [Thiomonas arsenitoxydans]CQR27186.1 putative permease [Thiomonas arsenitoxydans]CQR29706.1 putative permease [Thiomonas arsenitoxydans]CQR29715.1 putative permease [Thiomonas arsenitoxydans]CQR32832.1 putative permease [Thiomonas arsenitoxydans]
MPFIELFVLAAIWGASFLFLRIAVPEFGPLPLIALRVGIASLVLLPVLRTAAARAQFRHKLWPLLVVGVTNSALPFTLFAVGALHLGAGFEAILNATTPLWAAVLGATLFGAPIGRAQIVGLGVGLLGVVVLVGDQPGLSQGAAPWAVAAVLLAPVSYGFAVHYARRHLAGVDPALTAFGSQLTATVLLALPAALTWPAHAVQGDIWAAVVALGVLCTGLAYVLYFRLVAQVGAAYAASVTFLIPVFGMLWGALFLQEAVTSAMLAGCAIILAGTALASGQWKRLVGLRA